MHQPTEELLKDELELSKTMAWSLLAWAKEVFQAVLKAEPYSEYKDQVLFNLKLLQQAQGNYSITSSSNDAV